MDNPKSAKKGIPRVAWECSWNNFVDSNCHVVNIYCSTSDAKKDDLGFRVIDDLFGLRVI